MKNINTWNNITKQTLKISFAITNFLRYKYLKLKRKRNHTQSIVMESQSTSYGLIEEK